MNYFEAISSTLAVGGAITFLGASLWFIGRGFKDQAFPDIVLFLTGISIIAYAFTRWDRTKYPLFIALSGFIATFVGSIAAEMISDEQQAVYAFNRGVVYSENGEPDKATADYTEAIRLNPKDAGFFYNRGVAFRDKGEMAKAEADYAKAKDLGYEPQ